MDVLEEGGGVLPRHLGELRQKYAVWALRDKVRHFCKQGVLLGLKLGPNHLFSRLVLVDVELEVAEMKNERPSP